MRMLTFLGLVLLIFLNEVRGQCVLDFGLPDTVCSSDSLTFALPAGLEAVEWDFCSSDDLMSFSLEGQFNLTSALATPRSLSVVKHGSGYLGFVYNQNIAALYRLELSPSLDQVLSVTQVTYNAPTSQISASAWSEIHFIQENQNWYGITASESNRLIVLDFGSSLTNNTIGFTSYNNSFGLVGLRDMHVERRNDSVFCYALSMTNSNLVRLTFGNSVTNAPVLLGTTTISFLNGPNSFDVVKDCDVNHFVMTSLNEDKVFVGDFNEDFSAVQNPVQVGGTVNTPIKSFLFLEGGDYHAVIKNRNNNLELTLMDFGSALTATPNSTQTFSSISGMLVGWALDVVRTDSSEIIITGINNSGSRPWYSFKIDPAPCDYFAQTSLTDAVLFYQNTGWQYIYVQARDTVTNERYQYFDSIYVASSPSISFTVSDTCIGAVVPFVSNATVPVGSVVSWSWDFGDTSPIATGPTTSHLYQQVGAYTVVHTAQTDLGCSAADSQEVVYHPRPALSILSDSICRGQALAITNNTTIAFDSISQWVWQVGTDTLDTLAEPLVGLDTVGMVQVSALASSTFGCSSDTTFNVFVKEGPIADFTIDSTCFGNSTKFLNSSSSPGAFSVFWDLGDGATSSLSNPEHQYSSLGGYDVLLIATAQNGCVDSASASLLISPVPTIDVIALGAVCQGQEVVFDVAVSSIDTLASTSWTFQGQPLGVLDELRVNTDSIGLIAIKAVSSVGTACKVEKEEVFDFLPGPLTSIAATSFCQGDTVLFQASVVIPAGQTASTFQWLVDGENATGGQQFPYFFEAAGVNSAQLVLTTDSGCMDTSRLAFNIVSRPQVAIALDAPFCTSIETDVQTAVQIDTNDSITAWYLSQSLAGNVLDSADLLNASSIELQAAGIVSLVSTLSTEAGCQIRWDTTIVVFDSPALQLDTLIETCVLSATKFKDNYSGSNYRWLWSFGDGSSISQDDPTHTYSDTGSFDGSLELKDLFTGCDVEANFSVIVNPIPELSLLDNIFCPDETVILNPQLSDPMQTLQSVNWVDLTSGKTYSRPVLSLDAREPGVYPLNVSFTTSVGCQSIGEVRYTTVEALEPMIQSNLVYGAVPLEVRPTVLPFSYATYTWVLAGDTIDSTESPTFRLEDEGVFALVFSGLDSSNCRSTSSIEIYAAEPYLDLEMVENQVVTTSNGISFSIINRSTIPVESMLIEFRSNESGVFVERFDQPLLPGEFKQLESVAMFPIANAEMLCAEIIGVEALNGLSGDENELNNKVCAKTCCESIVYDPFPNPTTGLVTVPVYFEKESTVQLRVYDAFGRSMIGREEVYDTGLHFIEFDLALFSVGVYVLSIANEDKLLSGVKIIVQ